MKDIKHIKKLALGLFTFAGTETGTDNVQVSTDSNISAQFKTYYDNRLIRKAGPNLVFAQFAVKRPLPQGSGKTIEFRGFHELDTDVNARRLTEGQTPAAQKLKVYTITATIAQYGGWVGITDMVKTTSIDPMVTEAIDALSAQAEVVLDKLIRNTINGDDEVAEAYAGNAEAESALTPTGHKITVADIRRIVNMLKRANAPKIDGAYPLILHTDVSTDLQADEEYKELYHYLKPANLAAGYVGDVAGARIYESTNVLITKNATSGKAVYHNVLVGQGSYGTVELKGGGLRTIVKQLGSAGSSDPLDQRGSVGWKAATVSKVLIPKYLVNYSCCSETDATDDAETTA
jgi:N4-gp56 family major capsid protein